MSNFFKRIFESLFVVQVDPWTKKVSQKRIALSVSFIAFAGLFLVLNSVFKPFDLLSQNKNDQQRIADLEKLKLAIINFQKNTGEIPKIPVGYRFLTGGVDSANSPSDNWLGVDLSKYLASVPVDPKFGQNSTAPYPFRYTADGILFKLDAFLEANSNNLMQQDGGILNMPGNSYDNRSRYEVGTGLSLKF